MDSAAPRLWRAKPCHSLVESEVGARHSLRLFVMAIARYFCCKKRLARQTRGPRSNPSSLAVGKLEEVSPQANPKPASSNRPENTSAMAFRLRAAVTVLALLAAAGCAAEQAPLPEAAGLEQLCGPAPAPAASVNGLPSQLPGPLLRLNTSTASWGYYRWVGVGSAWVSAGRTRAQSCWACLAALHMPGPPSLPLLPCWLETIQPDPCSAPPAAQVWQHQQPAPPPHHDGRVWRHRVCLAP